MSFIQITDTHFVPGDALLYGTSPKKRLTEAVDLIRRFHGDAEAVLLTGDEEIGAGTSRALIEDTVRDVEAVLVLEAAQDDAVKVARKGIGTYRLEVTGRAAHAGLEPEAGCRMGICHSCDSPLRSGRVRDLRTGEVHGEADQMIQTCITAAGGDCTVELETR